MNLQQLFLSIYGSLSKETLKSLYSLFKMIDVKKGTILIETNKKVTDFFYIRKGIVRCYANNEDGKPYTKSIYKSEEVFSSLSALVLNKQSEFDYQCLTDCEIVKANYNDFMELTKTNKEVNLLYIKVLEFIFIKFERRIIELSSLNATQRYLKLKSEIPTIEELIPLYHIASYLNITPVQLSRIRKEIYSK